MIAGISKTFGLVWCNFRRNLSKVPLSAVGAQPPIHHRGVLVGRAVLGGCGVDFSGNDGHFFGLGTARQRLARAAYFTAIGAERRCNALLLNGPVRNIHA